MMFPAAAVVAVQALILGLAFLDVQSPPGPGQNRIPAAFTGVAETLDAPNVDGGWSVLIAKRGGIAGKIRPDVIVRSDGLSQCNGGPCSQSLTASARQTIGSLLAEPWPVSEMSLSDICSDCTQTLVVASRRNARGEQQIRIAFWDETTAGRAPDSARRLAASLASTFWTDSAR